MKNNTYLLGKIFNLSSSDVNQIVDSDLSMRELIFSDSDYLKECLKLNEALISKLSAIKQLFEEMSLEELQQRFVIKEPKDVLKYLKTILSPLSVEHFVGIFLNKGNAVVDHVKVRGSSDTVQPDYRFILKRALISEATGIICAHNHPGGNTKPSSEDIRFTFNLKKNVGTFKY